MYTTMFEMVLERLPGKTSEALVVNICCGSAGFKHPLSRKIAERGWRESLLY